MSSGPTLDYAPPKPRRWRRLSLRILGVAAVLAVVVVAGLFAVVRLQTYFEERRLAAYQIPPGMVMLSEDSAEAAALRAKYGKDVYQAGRYIGRDTAGHLPAAQWDLSLHTHLRQRVTYYLGTRDAGRGPRVVLVGMNDLAQMARVSPAQPPLTPLGLFAQVYEPGGPLRGGRVLSDGETAAPPFVTPLGTLRVYDAKSDPADAARFSFHYSPDKGNAEVRGQLLPDDTVRLTVDEPEGPREGAKAGEGATGG